MRVNHHNDYTYYVTSMRNCRITKIRMPSVQREWHGRPLCRGVDFEFGFEGAKGLLGGLQHPVCGVGEEVEETGEAGALNRIRLCV